MYKAIKLLIISVFFLGNTYSQNFNTKKLLCNDCENNLYLKIESTSFLKNNEYFNPYTKGFTGIGVFLKPAIEYYISQSTKVDLGAYLLKYSGVERFNKVIPLFSIQQKLGENIDLIFGNLHGTLSHQIEEPLFRFDRYYQYSVEYGVQVWYHSPTIESDLWINWEKYIFKNSPFQEEFTIGSVSNFRILKKNRFSMYLPLQLFIFHKGGQIDSSPKGVSSIFNGVIGFSFRYQLNEFNTLGLESLFFKYKGLDLPSVGENSQLFDKGKAVYFKLKYIHKKHKFSLGYWKSNQFIAPKGEYLFLNISEYDNTFGKDNKELVTAKFSTEYSISKSVKIGFRMDGYFDLENADLSHSAGLYLLLKDSFFLRKLKK